MIPFCDAQCHQAFRQAVHFITVLTEVQAQIQPYFWIAVNQRLLVRPSFSLLLK